MITTDPITDLPEPVACPHCEDVLFRVGRHEIVGRAPYVDSDAIPLQHRLTKRQRRGTWGAILLAGDCYLCAKPCIGMAVKLMDKPAGDEIVDTYFYGADDPGAPTNFVAWSGAESWIIYRYDTPQGPMLEHQLGPFADTFGSWQGDNGVSSCASGGPWDFAIDKLVELWDELREVPTSLGLASDDPRAKTKTRRARRPTVPPSLAAQPEIPSLFTTEPTRPAARRAAVGDDDIPF